MSANPKTEPFNAGDEDHVAQQAQSAKQREITRRAGLAKMMGSPEGRLWMYDLLDFCGVFRSSFTGNSETFMREGQRNVGLRVMADIQRDHDQAYVQMCREAKAYGARGFQPKAVKDKEANREEANDA